MNERTDGIADQASGPAIPVMTDRPPLDLEQIRGTIRTITNRTTVPIALRIEDLEGKIRGHLGELLKEFGRPDDAEDYELRCMLREANSLVQSDMNALRTRRERWAHVGILTASTKGLLRRYEELPAD